MTVMTEWTPPPPTRISAPDEAGAVFLVVSRPEGLTTYWEGAEPDPDLRTIVAEQASALSNRALPGRHREEGGTFLRLTVRPVSPEHEVTSSTSYSVGFEVGTGAAPPDCPRLPARALFEHAASKAAD